MRVAIIGGGISGLSAAFYLQKERENHGTSLEYVLFESTGRVGGSMQSEVVDGCLIEGGPDSFISEKPWAANLCQELGIGNHLIGSNDAERKTYILVNSRLVAMPDGLMFMVPTKLIPTAMSRLFSLSTKIRMGFELMHPPRPMKADETVAEMVERHFGREVVDRLADPLLSGVYGGDASTLSAKAVLPRFVDMEEKHGSLSRAMIAAHSKMIQARKNAPAAKPRPLFSSLHGGMQQMVDAILERIDLNSIRLNTSVQQVTHNGHQWLVTTASGTEPFDGVILATSANTAGALIESVNSALSEDLKAILYSSSTTITFGYSSDQLKGLPPGFGFLVPRSEGVRMLACTFVHCKFPNRAPEGKGLIRCFIGGTKDKDAQCLTDDQVKEICLSELQQILKMDTLREPRFHRIYRWNGAMAQYTPGHLDRVTRIETAVKAMPGLAIIGNAFHGIGVPDCIRSGQEAAATMAALSRSEMASGKLIS